MPLLLLQSDTAKTLRIYHECDGRIENPFRGSLIDIVLCHGLNVDKNSSNSSDITCLT